MNDKELAQRLAQVVWEDGEQWFDLSQKAGRGESCENHPLHLAAMALGGNYLESFEEQYKKNGAW